MRVIYLPVLQILRDLYVQPRDITRFRRYIASLTRGRRNRRRPRIFGATRSPRFYLAGRSKLSGSGDNPDDKRPAGR